MKARVVFFLSIVILLLPALSLAKGCCVLHISPSSSANSPLPCHDHLPKQPCCHPAKVTMDRAVDDMTIDLSADIDCQCDQSLVHYVLPSLSPIALLVPLSRSYLLTFSSDYYSRALSVLDRPPIT